MKAKRIIRQKAGMRRDERRGNSVAIRANVGLVKFILWNMFLLLTWVVVYMLIPVINGPQNVVQK